MPLNAVFDVYWTKPMTEAERRARLLAWLDIISKDVQDLLLDDHVYWELQKLIKANPTFQQRSGFFNQWMTSSFAQATAVGVRRQAKKGEDSISLARFLDEVKANRVLVSREHYLSLFVGKPDWLRDAAGETFDRRAGVNESAIPVSVVESQISDLKAAVGAIEHFVDRRVAHYDKRGLAQPTPTFDDLTNSLRALEKLVLFYSLLLTGASMDTLRPTLQFDWQDVFNFPWTAPSSSEGELM